MARSHARLQFGMWRKPGHEKVSKDARHLYTTILLDETLNQAGVVRLSLDVWADDAAMTSDEVREALLELIDLRFVVVDHHELLVRTFIRNDGVAEQPNVLRNALVIATQVRSPILRRALAAELLKLPAAPPPRETTNGRKFVYPDPHAVAHEIDPNPPSPPSAERYDDPSRNPSGNPSETHEFGTLPGTLQGTPRGRGRGRGGSSSSVATSVTNLSSSAAPPREDVESLCRHLHDRLVGNGCRVTITDSWRTEARLLLDRDHRDLAEAHRLIDWCQDDPFWRPNIGGMPKFRKQYDQLRLKAQSEGTALRLVSGGTNRVPTTSQRVQAALAYLEPEEH